MKILFLRRISIGVLFFAALTVPAAARELDGVATRRDIEVIDIPTANVLDQYGYNVGFRFGSDGNLQNKTVFGLFPRLNLGFALDGEHIIGTDDVRLNKPTINLKFRPFDGKGIIPALAIGYDGQGYVYNKGLGEYEQREMGFYLVGTSEIFVPDLNLHIGVNAFDFDHSNPARGFIGMNYNYQQTVGLMAEWVSATEEKEHRVNFGARYFVTPFFTVDFIGRNIPKGTDTSGRETERIVKLGYTGSF